MAIERTPHSMLRAVLRGPLGDRLSTLCVLGSAAVALAIPLWTARWLPFVDYPQHLGTIAAIHGQGDPAFARYFVVDYGRSQYLLLYVLGAHLAAVFGVEGAGRVTAVLSIATLPLAVAVYLRAHGRPAWLGALATPVALHTWVFWGFLNYAAAMALGIAALAAAAYVARRPDGRSGAILAIAALLTFYAHAQLYAWLGWACVVQLAAMAPVLGARRTFRAVVVSALAALPSLAGLLYWLHRSGVLERGEAGIRSGHAAQVAAEGAGPVWVPVAETIRGSLGHSFDVYRDGSGLHLASAFFLVALGMIALRGVASPPSSESAPGSASGNDSISAAPSHRASAAAGEPGLGLRLRTALGRLWARAPEVAVGPTLAPELVLVGTFALYLFAPYSYRLIEPINHRFLPVALALVPVLGPRAPLGGLARLLGSAALIVLAVVTGEVHAARFGETDREMGDLDRALEHTERGKRLLGLIYDAQSDVVPLPIYLHAHQYYQARVGGLACFSFVEFPKSPVQYAEGAAPPPFPPRFEWTPQRYDHGIWGDAFDYWLVRHSPGARPPSPFRRPSPSGAPTPQMIYEGDRWTLYAASTP